MTQDIDLRIMGMTCSGCSGRVTVRLKKTAGVIKTEVDHESGSATVQVEDDGPSSDELRKIIEDLGFNCAKCSGVRGHNAPGRAPLRRVKR